MRDDEGASGSETTGRTKRMKAVSAGFRFRMGDREVLVASDLEIEPGTITVLMGDSGVGKSTLCHAVARDRPDDAIVFQNSGGLQHLTVRDNLSLAVSGSCGRAGRPDPKDGIEEMVRGSGLSGGTRAEDLSGGERRRLAVACALAAEPEVVWMDEPDAGLDRRRVRRLADLLREAVTRESPPAIVLITHDPRFAALVRPTRIARIVREEPAGTGATPVIHLPGTSPAANERLTGAGVLSIIEGLDADAARGEQVSPPGPEANGPTDRRARSSAAREGGRFGSSARWMALAGAALSAFALPVRDRIARRTLAATLGMTTLKSAPYYLFVGAATGVVFVITLLLIPHVTSVWRPDALLASVSPHLLVRAGPAVAAVLLAASTGSLVASWVGQMKARRDLDAFRLLGADVDRRVLAPAVVGLGGAVVFGTLMFAAGMTSSFLLFLSVGGYAWSGDWIGPVAAFRTELGGLWTGLPALEDGVANNLVLGAAGETLLYAALLSLTTVHAATGRSVTSQESVADAIRRAIVRATLGVIVLKSLILVPTLDFRSL